jgi:hypothetical protein
MSKRTKHIVQRFDGSCCLIEAVRGDRPVALLGSHPIPFQEIVMSDETPGDRAETEAVADQRAGTPRERAEADALAEQHAEAEAFTIGPGVAGTKSQMRGGIGGLVLGTIIGAVLGWIVGAIVGGTSVTIICIIVGAVAGATAGGVVGGFLRPRQKLEGGEADI